MRPLLMIVLAALGCGGDDGAPDAGPDARPDAPPNSCQPQGATGQFVRRAGNPRVSAGAAFADAELDVSVADPDVHWSAAAQRWELYYGADHASAFDATERVAVIRRATSVDRMAWTIDDAPALTASPDAAAWDHVFTGAPTVVENPAAPADRRYLMMYAGARAAFPHPSYASPHFAIGAAFSADGVSFTRVPAAASPHGADGLVLTAAQVYPLGTDGVVADPELVLVDGVYHLFFSSFACSGAGCATVQRAGIAHATSPDGIAWTVREAPVRSLLRQSADLTSGGAQPSVIYDATRCRWELWLTSDAPAELVTQPVTLANMAGVWHADSSDGLAWSINYAFARELTWDAAAPGEPLGLRTGADVGANGNGRLMLFGGFDDQDVPAGFVLPDRSAQGFRPGVMTLNVATRDLP